MSDSKLEAAMARIKRLECPTADVSERVAQILADYGVAEPDDIEFEQGGSDDGARIYLATIGKTGQSIAFRVVTGDDDYVAKVTDITG